MNGFEKDELARYGRQVILPGFGIGAQEKLKSARVLLVGLGGLGSPVSLYLCAAGIGTLGLVDRDVVELHNLHRQVLFSETDVGRSKVEAGAERLRGLNSHPRLEVHGEGIHPDNARELIRAYDIVVDGSDNFSTRYLVNDACVLEGKPLVSGSIFQNEGQVAVFHPAQGGPCYRCLFPSPPAPGSVPNCAEAGVLGCLPGVIGSLQSNEVVKWITGLGDPLLGRLLHLDLATGRTRTVQVKRDPSCPVCGKAPEIESIEPTRYFADVCRIASNEEDGEEIEPQILSRRMQAGGEVVLLDVREPFEREMARIEPSLFIPMGSISEKWQSLPKEKDLFVYCHHGMRSLNVTRFLRNKGLSRAKNLSGGINAWSLTVDPQVPRY